MIAPPATTARPAHAPPARELLTRLFRAGADVSAVLEQACDWPRLLSAAQRHGLLGALEQLLRDRSAILPADARQRLEEWRAVERLWAGRLLENLEEALACLARHAVEVIPLKGPLLAARLHGTPLLRQCSDIDLLVQPKDLERARGALAEVGYQSEGGPREAYQRQHLHHVNLCRPGAAPLELHFRAFTGFGVVLPAECLFQGARPHESPGGHRCRVPDPVDEYLYLSVHAAGHAFERLAWLCDLQALRRQCPGLDLDVAAARARGQGLANAFGFCQAVLQKRLGIPSTQPRQQWRAAQWFLARIDRLPERSVRTTLATIGYQTALCDRPTTAARFLRHHLGRMARRRLQRLLPSFTPRGWSA